MEQGFCFEIIDGKDKGQFIDIPSEGGSVGKRGSIAVEGKSVEDYHAQLDYLDGKVLLRDLASASGTFVNGKQIHEHAIHVNDTVSVGSVKLALRKREEAAAAVAQSVPITIVPLQPPAAAKSLQPPIPLTLPTSGRPPAGTLSIALSAIAFLASFRNFWLVTFLTIAFAIANALTLSGVLTLIFLPSFFIGYILTVEKLVKKQPVQLADGIWFLRHGWNSLWHLLMVAGAFILTLAMLVTVIGIVAALFHITGIPEILERSVHPKPDFSAYPASAKEQHLSSFATTLGISLLAFISALAPLGVYAICVVTFFIHLAKAEMNNGFEMVCDVCRDMQQCVFSNLKAILLGGLIVAIVCWVVFVAACNIGAAFDALEKDTFWNWIGGVSGFLLTIYFNVFVIMLGLSLYECRVRSA